jgi:hypothetical protein
MSNSTTLLDTIQQSQAQKEVTANAMFDALSQGAMFGRRSNTTAGLTWGYYGGILPVSNVPTAIANGTIALTASTTNYLTSTLAGVVTKYTSSPTGWPGPLASGEIPLYEIVTGSASVTSYTDYRIGHIRPLGVYAAGKAVVNNNASSTYTVGSGITYVAFTGTQAASVAFTFPAAAAGIDGRKIDIYTQAAVGTSSTWSSSGASFVGSPATLAAGSVTRFVYHHATTSWLPA